MSCMGQIDVMSLCVFDLDKKKGDQTRRMQGFMDHYLYPKKFDENRVAIQLMRHTLMHTGALRYLYDETNQVAYTWPRFEYS
jgi:hypothetical protein